MWLGLINQFSFLFFFRLQLFVDNNPHSKKEEVVVADAWLVSPECVSVAAQKVRTSLPYRRMFPFELSVFVFFRALRLSALGGLTITTTTVTTKDYADTKVADLWLVFTETCCPPQFLSPSSSPFYFFFVHGPKILRYSVPSISLYP